MKTSILNFLALLKASVLKLLAVIATFLLPIKGLLITVIVVIILDTIYGVYRAKKRKENITSKKLSEIVSKTLLYVGSIIVVFAMEKYMLGDILLLVINIPFLLTKGLAATLVLIELTSISESYKLLTGISIWDKFKGFVQRAKDVKGMVGDLTPDKKDEESTID